MTEVVELPLSQIAPSFGNDRTVFSDDALQELADSIRANGLAQPITVRPIGHDAYQLIAGERRYRAHKLLGLPTIRAIVTPLTDEQASGIMLAENTARADLDPIDEANSYARRMREFGWSVADVARNAGKRVDVIQNRLMLLKLTDELQFMIRKGQLTVGYATVLANAELDKTRQRIALKQFTACSIKTPEVLREICVKLAQQQAQESMFDFVDAGNQTQQEFVQVLPKVPTKDTAPNIGTSYKQIALNQVKFWLEQADVWDRYGKRTERDLCRIAAKQAEAFAAVLPDHSLKSAKTVRGGKTYTVYAQQ